MMVTRRTAKGMFRLENGIGNQLPRVLILQTIKHTSAFMPRGNHSGHPHLRQMLGYRRLRFTHSLRQLIDRHLSVTQRKDQTDPRCIREHSEHFHSQLDIVTVHVQPTGLICIHANIMTL